MLPDSNVTQTDPEANETLKRVIRILGDEAEIIYPILPTGYQQNYNPDRDDIVYSSILEKFINTRTGLPIEE
jgi:hypothetical protein